MGIYGWSVFDIVMFCIGNDELVGIVFFDVGYSFFESDLFFYVYVFIKG